MVLNAGTSFVAAREDARPPSRNLEVKQKSWRASVLASRSFGCAFVFSVLFFGVGVSAGEVRFEEKRAVVEVGVWALPEPWRVDVVAKAERAVVRGFEEYYARRFEEVYRERYAQRNARWQEVENVEVRLRGFSGVTIEGAGMDSRPLMAIAGGVAPDVLYVNFRQ